MSMVNYHYCVMTQTTTGVKFADGTIQTDVPFTAGTFEGARNRIAAAIDTTPERVTITSFTRL